MLPWAVLVPRAKKTWMPSSFLGLIRARHPNDMQVLKLALLQLIALHAAMPKVAVNISACAVLARLRIVHLLHSSLAWALIWTCWLFDVLVLHALPFGVNQNMVADACSSNGVCLDSS